MSTPVNELLDELNSLFELVERAFAEIAATRVSVPLNAMHDLAFGKLANRWCLIVEVYDRIEAPRTKRYDNPLVNTSIEYRLAAVDKLEPLYEKLLVMSHEQVKLVQSAALRVAAFVGKLARDATERAEANK